MANSNTSRALLQFNDYDFRHRKVLEILRARPRNKTEFVANAVLHYISCPDASEDFNKETVRKLIKEVMAEMMADGSLQNVPADSTVKGKDTTPEMEDLGDIMSAFRGGS